MGTLYTHPIPALNAGATKTGYATNLSAGVYDSTGTLQANISSGWTERTSGSGSFVNFSGFARNTSWGAVTLAYHFNNVSGYEVNSDPIPIDPVLAGIVPGVAINMAGGILTVGTGSGQLNPDGTGAVPIAFGTSLPSAPAANTVGEALFLADLFGGRANTAQGGTTTTITLDAGASADTGAYVGDDVYLYGGTGGGIRGTGQRRTVAAYNPSTKVATVNRAWDTTPDSTTKFYTLPQAQAFLAATDTTAAGVAALTTTVGTINTSIGSLATAAALSSLATAVANLNNLSSLANLYIPSQLEIPATGTISYQLTMLVKDSEGHQADLSASPTIVVTNASGTSRASNLSSVTHAATGQYTATYNVSSGATEEGLTFVASGTAASDSTARLAIASVAVVAVDTATAIGSIQTTLGSIAAGTTVLRANDYQGNHVATDAHVLSIPTNPLTTLGTNAPSGWLNPAAFASGVLPTNFASLVITNGQGIGTSTFSGGAVSSVTGAVGSVTAPVTIIPADTAASNTANATIYTVLGGLNPPGTVGGINPLRLAGT